MRKKGRFEQNGVGGKENKDLFLEKDDVTLTIELV